VEEKKEEKENLDIEAIIKAAEMGFKKCGKLSHTK
jgi:hypothetical protein